MRYQAISIALILALMGAAVAMASDIYRWIDEDGNVHFEDRPAGEDSVRMAIESRPTDPARIRAAIQARNETRTRSAEAKAADELEKSSADERSQQASERAEKCTAYRTQLETYTNNRRLYRQTADGEREYLDNDEISERAC